MILSPHGDAATTPAPALFLAGTGPRLGSWLTPVLAVVAIVAGVVGLVVEALSGFSGTAQRRGTEFPAWVVWAAALAFGVGFFLVQARRAPWYRAWSMVEMLDRPDGIVLFAGRLGKNHEGLHVRRGETVEIAVSHQLRATYEYVVTAPSGSLRFTADGFPKRLTMQPLDEAAARHGITVVTTGAGTNVRRTATA